MSQTLKVFPISNWLPWDAIPFDEGDPIIGLANAAYADYNNGLLQAEAGMLISAEERENRTISFAAGDNGVVVDDESLTNLTALGLPSIRQTNDQDLVSLTAGAILGTLADPNNPFSVIGVGVPLSDEFTLLNHERLEVQTATTAFNDIIAGTIGLIGVTDRVALADVNKTFNDLLVSQPVLIDGLAVTASLAPPTGVFSEDGVHPNARGYALVANTFIEAINEKFSANVPLASLGDYPGTAPPQ